MLDREKGIQSLKMVKNVRFDHAWTNYLINKLEYGHDARIFELHTWQGIRWYPIFIDSSYHSLVFMYTLHMYVAITLENTAMWYDNASKVGDMLYIHVLWFMLHCIAQYCDKNWQFWWKHELLKPLPTIFQVYKSLVLTWMSHFSWSIKHLK